MKRRERAVLLRGMAVLLERELARLDAAHPPPAFLSAQEQLPGPGEPGGKDLAAERDRLRRAWQDVNAAAERAERKLADRCGDECD